MLLDCLCSEGGLPVLLQYPFPPVFALVREVCLLWFWTWPILKPHLVCKSPFCISDEKILLFVDKALECHGSYGTGEDGDLFMSCLDP